MEEEVVAVTAPVVPACLDESVIDLVLSADRSLRDTSVCSLSRRQCQRLTEDRSVTRKGREDILEVRNLLYRRDRRIRVPQVDQLAESRHTTSHRTAGHVGY